MNIDEFPIEIDNDLLLIVIDYYRSYRLLSILFIGNNR